MGVLGGEAARPEPERCWNHTDEGDDCSSTDGPPPPTPPARNRKTEKVEKVEKVDPGRKRERLSGGQRASSEEAKFILIRGFKVEAEAEESEELRGELED